MAALFAAIAIGCASSAHAARIVIITQPPSGGIVPQGGDPFYGFYMDAYLDVGYDLLDGDNFTIYSVPGVNASSVTYQPGPADGPVLGDTWTPSFDTAPDQVTWDGANHELVDQSNVTWTLNTGGGAVHGGPISNCPDPNDPNQQPLFLGTFGFQTYADLSPLPNGYTITFAYTVHAHDCDGNPVDGEGTVTLSLVPEPSSMALLALGAAVPAFATIRRRRRAA
jgi:hypothetical protein